MAEQRSQADRMQAELDELDEHIADARRKAQRTRERIPLTNDYMQAGERYQLSEQWERDDLVANLIDALTQCDRPIQERMLWHLYMCEDELGARVGEGIGITLDEVKDMAPLATQTLSDEEEERRRNLGNNGPRDVSGHEMTHCVPNERVAVADDMAMS